MKFKAAYTAMPRVQFETTGPSLARQAMKAECDINNVMRKYEKTGVLEHRNTFEGSYGDYTDAPQDYHEAINQVMAADAMFASLPATIRRRFGNDPAEYVNFLMDPANREEMRRMGLTKPAEGEVLEEATTPAKKPSKAPKSPEKASETPLKGDED